MVNDEQLVTISPPSQCSEGSDLQSSSYQRRLHAENSKKKRPPKSAPDSATSDSLPSRLPVVLIELGGVQASVLDALPDGILIINAEGGIAYANRAISILFPKPMRYPGDGQDEHPGLTAVVALAHNAINDQRKLTTQIKVPASPADPTGRPRTYQAIAAPFVNGPATSAWVMTREITDILALEKLREKFVAVASEELLTPLSLIHGYVETLYCGRFKGPGAISFGHCLKVIEKHTRRMMRLKDDLLTISSRRMSRTGPGTDPFIVRGCVEEALQTMTGLIERKRPDITLCFPKHGGVLHGDQTCWRQIFSQLIENALLANEVPGLSITLSGAWTDDQCILSVADNGIGILPEEIPFVFEHFFRCRDRKVDAACGSGLGLPLVKSGVEIHGGAITVASEPGRRTTFTMRVPCGATRSTN